jgi:hypothetical protein
MGKVFVEDAGKGGVASGGSGSSGGVAGDLWIPLPVPPEKRRKLTGEAAWGERWQLKGLRDKRDEISSMR